MPLMRPPNPSPGHKPGDTMKPLKPLPEFDFPPLSTVRERMRQVIGEHPLPRCEAPQSLRQTDQQVEAFVEQANHPDTGCAPDLHGLRPDRAMTQQALIERIAALPRGAGGPTPESWGEWPVPQAPAPAGETADRGYYLAPDREDALVIGGAAVGPHSPSFEHRGRTVKRDGDDRWTVSSACPNFAWKFWRVPTNPTLEWLAGGDLTVPRPGFDASSLDPSLPPEVFAEASSVPLGVHPERVGGAIDLYPDVDVSYWGELRIYSHRVYGRDRMGWQKLGFWAALDVAINWFEALEWAYGAAGRPAWLDGAAGPGREAREIGPGDAPVPLPADAEPDPLLDTLERVVASRRQARAELAEAKSAAAESERLQAEADAARERADAAARRAGPARRAIRESAGELLELLKADEDFPGIE